MLYPGNHTHLPVLRIRNLIFKLFPDPYKSYGRQVFFSTKYATATVSFFNSLFFCDLIWCRFFTTARKMDCSTVTSPKTAFVIPSWSVLYRYAVTKNVDLLGFSSPLTNPHIQFSPWPHQYLIQLPVSYIRQIPKKFSVLECGLRTSKFVRPSIFNILENI